MDRSVYHAAVWGSCNSLKDSTGEEDSKISSQLTCGQGNTSLHIATKSGNKKFAEEMLEKHPSLLLNQNAKGETALHIAARLGYVEVANLLIGDAKRRHQVVGEARTDHLLLRAVNQEKNTALHEAVRNGHGVMVELLIGEDLSLTCVTNAAGESPLFIAVDRKFYEIARRILEIFPSCSSSEKDGFLSGRSGMTVMHAAVIRLHYVPLGYIWKKHHLQRMWSAPLMARCRIILYWMYTTCLNLIYMGFRQTCIPSFTEEEFVNELLEKCGHEYDILEIQDDYGWMPLHYAARIGNSDVVELFLRKIKNLAYIKDREGMSALHISAGNGRNSTIIVLIKKCPDICELLDKRDRTALHVAVETGYYSVVNNLLHNRVFSDLINEKDIDGNTALHVAAIHGRYKILKKLANEKRVDKDAINKAGMTVIDIIRSSSHIAKDKKVTLIAMLKRNGSQPSLERRAFMTERVLEQIDGLKNFEMTLETELQATGGIDHAAFTTTAGNDGKIEEKSVRKHFRWSPEQVKNLAGINLLVATIIASITFSAAIAMPGGFDSTDGSAILRRKTSFRLFLALDSLAFGCSTASMSIHFLVTFTSRVIHETYAYPITAVLLLTLLSIASTVFAFIAGTNAVLSHRSGFSLSAFVALTSFIVPVSFFLVRLVIVLYKRFHLLVDSEK